MPVAANSPIRVSKVAALASRFKSARRGHQRLDVIGGEDVGDRAVLACREQAVGRDLGVGIEGVKVAGEVAGYPHPTGDVGSRAAGLGGPGGRQGGRDRRRPRLVEERHEVGEQASFTGQFVTQRPAQIEIVAAVSAKIGHRVTPGQGRTTSTSDFRSTFA